MKVFVSWTVDHLEGLTASALMADNVEELRQISSNIRRGSETVKAWAMAVGGSPILDLGTIGAVEVPADRMTELPAIAQKFEAICEGTLSVGVGMTLSESYTAMRFSSVKGGNQVSLYHVEMEDAVAGHDQEEPDQLAQLGKSQKVGSEEPVGFADGPSDDGGGQAGPPTDPQHGGADPAEGGGPMAAPSMSAAPDQAQAGDPNGGQVQQPGAEAGGDENMDPRAAVIQALQQIKQQAPVLEQMKQTNPEAFEAVKSVVQAMIMMAQGLSVDGGGEEGGGEEVQKSEQLEKGEGDAPQAPQAPAAPPAASNPAADRVAATKARHANAHKVLAAVKQAGKELGHLPSAGTHTCYYGSCGVLTGAAQHLLGGEKSGFWAYAAKSQDGLDHWHLKDINSGGDPVFDPVDPVEARSDWKFYHNNERHGFHRVQHYQGDKIKAVVDLAQKYLNQPAAPAAAPIEKGATEEQQGFAVGTMKDGKVKVRHVDQETGAKGETAWRSVRAGQVMSEDGHAVSSRNPGSK